jgi:ABC-type uncharacterized transport system permease subunit
MRGVRVKAFRKYAAAFSLSLQQSMEYRMDFFLGLLGSLVVILVQSFLWTAVFQSGSIPGGGWGKPPQAKFLKTWRMPV